MFGPEILLYIGFGSLELIVGEMPSKTKKNSKAQSRLLNGDQSAAPPRTPSLIPSPNFEVSEENLVRSFDEASTKYPALIGKSAFIGKVIDVERESRGCKIWLSEPSMVASSLAPGTIVSVMLHSVKWNM